MHIRLHSQKKNAIDMKSKMTFLAAVGLFFNLSFFGDLNAKNCTHHHDSSSKLDKLNANNDLGFWLEENLKGQLSDRWNATFFIQQRWGAKCQIFWYHFYLLYFQYDLTKCFKNGLPSCSNISITKLSIGPGIGEYIVHRKNTRDKYKWVSVLRPILEANFALVWDRWEFTQRLRVEYQSHNSSHYKNFANVRYRVEILTPWKFTSHKIRPYISNELFFRNNTYRKSHPSGLVGLYYENRFKLGFVADSSNEIFSSQIYWQWRTLRQRPGTHPEWFNTYQFGLALTAKF